MSTTTRALRRSLYADILGTVDGVRAFHTCVGQNALPTEEETEEIARRDGLDLGAQSTHGVSVYAREQAALAPLLRCCVRAKASPQREALGLE